MQKKGFCLSLKRSRYLVMYSLVIHCLAFISVLSWEVEPAVKVLFSAGLAISLFFYLYRLGFIGQYRKQPSMLLLLDEERWQIRYADTTLTADLLLESVWMTRFAVITNFKAPNQRRLSLLVLKDAVDKEKFRLFRVQIRLAFFQQ